MYGIFTYIWAFLGVNIGKYSTHGASGNLKKKTHNKSLTLCLEKAAAAQQSSLVQVHPRLDRVSSSAWNLLAQRD